MKKRGIFFKVFIYSIIFSILLVSVSATLLSTQIMSYLSRIRMQEIDNDYKGIVIELQGNDNIAEIANRFYEKNQSMQFYIKDIDGNILYETSDADASGIEKGEPPYTTTIMYRLDNDYLLIALRKDLIALNFSNWIGQGIMVIMGVLAVCVLSAYVFARQMTKPIKRLADSAGKMARLEDVQPEPERKDELGTLARDVHAMYDKLKETIANQKDEILREREMEETQRYFFSAASHELKTPIAATGVLLEGMLENIGDYKDHPKYLRECIKLTDTQNELISEILEIVNLIDGKIIPAPERLKLYDTVMSVLPACQTLAESAGQRISVSVQEEAAVFTDSKMLKRVLSNVILNAVQNAPTGAEIRIWSEPADDKCRLFVLNTNTSIDEKILPRLFDPFYRADKARNRKDKRSGLGLTIVQKTLKAMDADFSLENTNDGVLFWMELPKVKLP